MKAKQYVPHITGLRGIAIILVLLFHLFKAFSNGYVGVHVFLVISGYFLFRDFWNGNYDFSWKQFCSKKIVRLFPCAIVVSFCTCLAALCFLPYDIVLKTANSAIATIIGVPNIYYDYAYSDYFAASSITNPLVHTWYLGVIIQLYIIAGCIKILCKCKTRTFKVVFISILFAISVLLYYTPLWIDLINPFHGKISTYYWSWGHLWMVLAGAYAPLLQKLDTKIPGKAVGNVALLIICLFGLFPLRLNAGLACLMEIAVVCMSVACICYGGAGWSRNVLNNTIVSTTGKVSFSLYLAHWPIISIFFMASASWSHNLPLRLFVISVICIATCVMYLAVERPSHNIKGIIAAWTACFLMSIVLIYTDGMRDVVHATANAVRPISYYELGKVKAIQSGPMYDSLPNFRQETHQASLSTVRCLYEEIPLLYQIGDSSKAPSFILIGDSHAEALYPGLDTISREEGWSGVYLHTYVIPFTRYYSMERPYQLWDSRKEEQLIRYLEDNENVKTVFIGSYWSYRLGSNYLDSDGKLVDVKLEPDKDYSRLRDFIYQIHSIGKQVVIFRDVPTIPTKAISNYVWFCTQYGRKIDETALSMTREQYDAKNYISNEYISRLEAEGLCRVLRADEALLQGGSFCGYRDGKFYYLDNHHLSFEGSAMVMRYLKEAVRSILESNGGK